MLILADDRDVADADGAQFGTVVITVARHAAARCCTVARIAVVLTPIQVTGRRTVGKFSRAVGLFLVIAVGQRSVGRLLLNPLGGIRGVIPTGTLRAGAVGHFGPGEGFIWLPPSGGELRNDSSQPAVVLIVLLYPQKGTPVPGSAVATPVS